jgi:hypothetical protein
MTGRLLGFFCVVGLALKSTELPIPLGIGLRVDSLVVCRQWRFVAKLLTAVLQFAAFA